jgi:hypothetical protein
MKKKTHRQALLLAIVLGIVFEEPQFFFTIKETISAENEKKPNLYFHGIGSKKEYDNKC